MSLVHLLVLLRLILEDGSSGIAVFKSDEAAAIGDQIDIAILHNNSIIILTTVDPPITFAADMLAMMDSSMLSFSLLESGEPVVFGCTDNSFTEYDSSANLDDESCLTAVVFGCTDASACNFDAAANTDDASCLLPSGCESCDGNGGVNANDDDGDGVCNDDEIDGCMNSAAC